MVLRNLGSLKAFALMLTPALLLACASVSNAAVVVATDDFSSSTGTGLLSGSTWNYEYSGTPSTGAMTVNKNAPMYATHSLDSEVNTDFYFSYTMEIESGVSMDPNKLVQFYFDSDPSNSPGSVLPWSYAPSVGLKTDQGGAGTSDFQVRWGFSDQQYAGDAQAGDIVGIVAKLSKSTGTVYDTLELWVTSAYTGIPDFSALGAPDATSFNDASTLSSVATIGVFGSHLEAGDSVLLDNVVMATVPEPMTMALWGMGGIAGLAYSARRRKLARSANEAA